MSASAVFIRLAREYIPTPFTIAVVLSFVTLALALFLTSAPEGSTVPYVVQVADYWQQGFWDLLKFAMQMMMMLVLGHVLAMTKPVDAIIQQVVKHCTTTPKSAALVCFVTMVVGLFNWGLALIFGAILARKVGENAAKQDIPLNYPIIGAAGYSGLMVWHGGLSGSAPLKVAEEGHFLVDKMGIVPLGDTVFSTMNIVISIAVLIIVPMALFWLGRNLKPSAMDHLHSPFEDDEEVEKADLSAAQKLDRSVWMARGFGGFILGLACYDAFIRPDELSLSFLNPNFINFVLFGLGLMIYGCFIKYVKAVEEAIVGASGIMIQFPIYAGIAGVMKYSGLVTVYSDFLAGVANEVTFPVFTLISAGVVNVFVPSGGGQWAVQGPIIIEATNHLGLSLPKSIMAMAYGDQLTNMLQPFWALPLLAITKLQAQDILPYTAFMMLIGGAVYTVGLLIF